MRHHFSKTKSSRNLGECLRFCFWNNLGSESRMATCRSQNCRLATCAWQRTQWRSLANSFRVQFLKGKRGGGVLWVFWVNHNLLLWICVLIRKRFWLGSGLHYLLYIIKLSKESSRSKKRHIMKMIRVILSFFIVVVFNCFKNTWLSRNEGFGNRIHVMSEKNQIYISDFYK